MYLSILQCDVGTYTKKQILDEARGLERVVDIPLYEISAKTGAGVADLFDAAVSRDYVICPKALVLKFVQSLFIA